MKREELYDLLEKELVILDGATGTELQKRGMPEGVCPETWLINNREILVDIQREYIKSGSRIIYTPTFGANRVKLKEYGIDDVMGINKELTSISKEASEGQAYIAGDLAPTGLFIKPVGEYDFEYIVDVYKEQVRALLQSGVDLFVIETMLDLQEARAALIAIKETCDLPAIVSMTYQSDNRTLTGSTPESATIALQSLGADVVGLNCSTGPDTMLELLKRIKSVASVPVIAKPNAGLPKVCDGVCVYDMDSDDFSSYAKTFAEAGVNLYGGCCGTTPLYIKKISQELNGYKPKPWENNRSVVTSISNTVYLDLDRELSIVGERINPTGKKKLQAELKEGRLDLVKKYAQEQKEKGATILDVNMGMPGIDEKETMLKAIEVLSQYTDLPLCIDSSSVDVIESALRIYPGRALVNSISAENKKLESLMPIVAKYGAMFIALPLDDNSVPKTCDERVVLLDKIYSRAKEYGYTWKDIVVDGLVMTVSADANASKETLSLIKHCRDIYECNTIIGLSNVSFGLPSRMYLNSGFLALAIANGLSMAIANPNSSIVMDIKRACDVLCGRDKDCINYINYYKDKPKTIEKKIVKQKDIKSTIYDDVIKGEKEKIIEDIKMALDSIEPFNIINDIMIPAINKVGDLYDKKEYFLPQLILSAKSMEEGFKYLEPMLTKDNHNVEKKKLIIATVKGDIHDIGKNIVTLMLKNHGLDVIDMGKNVDRYSIIDKIEETGASIVMLSALMTTTMYEMKKIIDLAKEKNLDTIFLVGGAVVTKEFADEIGADGYAEDATSAVNEVKKFISLG